MKVKIKRVDKSLPLPKYETSGAVAFDLYSRIDMEIFPKQLWGKLSHLLIYHGRSICIARKPKCPKCPLKKSCPSYPIFMKKFFYTQLSGTLIMHVRYGLT